MEKILKLCAKPLDANKKIALIASQVALGGFTPYDLFLISSFSSMARMPQICGHHLKPSSSASYHHKRSKSGYVSKLLSAPSFFHYCPTLEIATLPTRDQLLPR